MDVFADDDRLLVLLAVVCLDLLLALGSFVVLLGPWLEEIIFFLH